MRRDRRRPFWYLRRRPDAVQAEVDEELDVHLSMRADELEASGLPPDAARREALRQFGDLEGTRQYCRQEDLVKTHRTARALALVDLLQDAKVCLRGLLRSPTLTTTIVLTVGLGIGLTTAIFAGVNAALLRPLPYAEPDRLVRIYTDAPPNVFRFSVADFLALQVEQTEFEAVAGYTERAMSFSGGDTAERLTGRVVSWTYFDVLRLQLQLGRGFAETDGRPGSPPAVVLSHAFWRDRLGGRPDVIGTAIRLDAVDHIVTGVLPPAVGPLEARQDFFVAAQWTTPSRKGPFFIIALGRLREGATLDAARSELRAINKRLFPIWRSSYQDDRATWNLMDLKAHVVGADVDTISGVAIAAVGLMWLIACANASSLLLARVVSRRRELAVRTALGASRGRVLRLLMAEGAVLAVGALVVGVAIAWMATSLLRDFGAAFLPRTHEIALDGIVLWLLLALTAASALLFGLVPALHGSGGPVGQSLRLLDRSATGSVQAGRLRRLLVGSQFAIATPLLVVAGLLLGSLHQLRQVDLGFDGRNMLTGFIQLPGPGYAAPDRVQTFWNELGRGVEQVPGVTAVTFANGVPPAGVDDFNNFDLEQSPTPPGQSQPVTPWVAVTPEYFTVLGLTLVQGRLLEDRDLQESQRNVIVVDQAWARRFFPTESAVGKRLKSGGCTSCDWTTVVGVVSDVKYAGLDTPDEGTVYTPLTGGRFRYLLLRTSIDPTLVTPAVRQVLRTLDPTVPLANVATMDDLVASSLETPVSLSLLIGGLAAVALVLSLIGIYGMMAHHVQQHAKDIGIRLALGGTPGGVLRFVVGRGMRVVIGGVAVGVIGAWLLTQSIRSLLFGIGTSHPPTFAAVGVILLVIAAAACIMPARRAVRVDPASVLRDA
jgi:predicted permease